MPNSAILPALFISAIVGAGVYSFGNEIKDIGGVARRDLSAYVASVPRDFRNLGSDWKEARREVRSDAAQTAGQMTIALREIQDVMLDGRFIYRRTLMNVRSSGNLKLAFAGGIAGFLVVYYRGLRRKSRVRAL